MAPFSSRKPAPQWPPFKDSYQRLGDDDDIQMMLKPDIDTAASHTSGFLPTPTPRQPTFTHKKRGWWVGWRGGAKVAFFGALFVFVVNTVLIISMMTAFPRMDGMSMIYIGSCAKTERINMGVHLAVNLLSTGLLAGSTYCMQILSAPTRKDIDKAHSKGVWLDIGIPSLRNLRTLRKQKVILWWLLAASSIPLHLFYNSVFFTAIATNDYNVIYATEGFASGAFYDRSRFRDTIETNFTRLQSLAPTFERLSNEACIEAYAVDFVTERSNVIAVIRSNSTMRSSIQKATTNVIPAGAYNSLFDSYAWICDDPSTPSIANMTQDALCSRKHEALEATANTTWRSGGYAIQYCLSQRIEPDCHVHFSPQIMAPVLLFNIVKALVMMYVGFFYKDKPLVTLGDAIESFTLQPDPTTQGMCLATRTLIEKYWVHGYTPQPMKYDGRRRRWYESATRRQWLSFGTAFAIAGVGVAVSIVFGILHMDDHSITTAWNLGLGKVRTWNLITGLQVTSLRANAVFVTALIANTPQTLFSFLYILYNNVFTNMVISDEWDRFSIKHNIGRVLRVSEPRGDQRSTYFLQIPYRYALVMMGTSGILHWLVSQSLFLANISVLPLDGIKPKLDEITTCAYSVQGMFFIVAVGAFMLLWIGANSLRKFSGGMPFVASNSAAISAACHTEYGLGCEREAMVLKPLRWGVTDYGNRKSARISTTTLEVPGNSSGDEGSSRGNSFDKREARYDDELAAEESYMSAPVGHCTFTDGRVAKPVSGRFYS